MAELMGDPRDPGAHDGAPTAADDTPALVLETAPVDTSAAVGGDAAAARELYLTRPAYWSRPSPPTGRSRRVRLPKRARCVAESRLRPTDGTLYRGALDAAPAHAAPRGPGPFPAIWPAFRCPGPPAPCLGTARHLAGRVWRVYGTLLAYLFVVYNKPEQNNRGGTRDRPVRPADRMSGFPRPHPEFSRPRPP